MYGDIVLYGHPVTSKRENILHVLLVDLSILSVFTQISIFFS